MELMREPLGVDLVVDSREITKKEKQQISEVISHYKSTGEVKKIVKRKVKKEAVEK